MVTQLFSKGQAVPAFLAGADKLAKGQAVPEYVLLVCGVMMVILVMLIVQSELDKDANAIKLQTESARVASKLALAINQAYFGGSGTQILIYNFAPAYFNVSVTGRTVLVSYNTSHWITNTVTNRTVGGNTTINKMINVSNINGWIYVNTTN